MPKSIFGALLDPNASYKMGERIAGAFGPSSTPQKRRACPKAVKETVWKKYCGNKQAGKCYVCKKPIDLFNYEVGHNKAFSKGGEWNVNNLRPICRTCNRSMGTMNLEKFKKKYFSKRTSTKKKPKKRAKKRTNLFGINTSHGKGWKF